MEYRKKKKKERKKEGGREKKRIRRSSVKITTENDSQMLTGARGARGTRFIRRLHQLKTVARNNSNTRGGLYSFRSGGGPES